jgi:hypothetical protein
MSGAVEQLQLRTTGIVGCSTAPLIDVEGRHFTTGCGLRGVRQSTSRAITQSLAYIIHYSHATCIFEDHHVLRAFDENESLRPDLTVFNAPSYNASLLVNISVVQSFPDPKSPFALLPRKPPDFLSLQHQTSHSAYNDKVNKYTPKEFPFYPLLWSLMVSFTQLPSYFSKI